NYQLIRAQIMKTATLSIEGLNLDRLLQEAGDQDVVFLRTNGEVKFAIMHADESDQEVCALKSNPEFMSYLTECHQRADSEPRFSLEQLREMYGLPPTSVGPNS